MEKQCKACGETKLLTEFGADNSTKDGRMPRCRICKRSQRLKYTCVCVGCGTKFLSRNIGTSNCSKKCLALTRLSKHKDGKRLCKKCSVFKPLDSFVRKRDSSDGRTGFCKDCRGVGPKGRVKLDFKKVKEDFESFGHDLLEGEYKGSKVRMKFRCSCGRESKISYNNMMKGQKCFACGRESAAASLRIDFNYVSNFFRDKGCELLSTEYVNNSSKLRFTCQCGSESVISFQSFKLGSRCRYCAIQSRTGHLSATWNPEITDEMRRARRGSGINLWRKQVFERDNYTCKVCGDKTGGNLNAHHLNGWHWFTEGRECVNNGVTLCTDCHKDFHSIYGYKGNTVEQFRQYALSKDVA